MVHKCYRSDGDNITLNALGGPISEVENTATFTNLGGGLGEFAWAPTLLKVDCSIPSCIQSKGPRKRRSSDRH